jgi:Family of unknown function (DUF6519)
MHGDFSRITFRPRRRYTGVLMQQGRVQLDADWNEQVAITEQLARMRFVDLVGRSAAPAGGLALRATGDGVLELSAGRIYAGGLACELDESTLLSTLLRDPLVPAAGRTDLVYLEAWEHHVTAIDDPDLREPALGGPDTTTRLRVAWRPVVLEDVGDASPADADAVLPRMDAGRMLAAAPGGYTGLENRLYRVEIHDRGEVGTASFKWSRRNASVAFAVDAFTGPAAVRLVPGPEQTDRLRAGDTVEVTSETTERAGLVGTLACVLDVSDDGSAVALDRDVSNHREEAHPRLRRWDQPEGAALPVAADPIGLEDGIEVRFCAGELRPGDYWTFPARTATGVTVWPGPVSPHGVERVCAPLALVTWEGSGPAWKPLVRDCRKVFSPLGEMYEELARLSREVADLRQRLEALER